MASQVENLMNAVKDRITDNIASLTGFPGANNVSVMLYIDSKNVHFPHIFITPVGSESVPEGDNANDDWIRPILVTIAIRDHEDRQDLSILEWRQYLLKLFRTRKMKLDVPGNCRVQVQPGNQIDIVVDQYQYIISSFTILPTVREERPTS